MHVEGFLHTLLGPVIHQNRVKVISEVVQGVIQAKQLQLTAVGRSLNMDIQERSGIQKTNRLLANEHLWNEREEISRCVIQVLVGVKKHPVVLVDWTKYPNSSDVVLRASLAAEGRALTLYEERHSAKKLGNKKIEKRFLRALKRLLPSGCHPIVVTDAGFHNDWFKECIRLGWDYLGRIRGAKKYRRQDQKEFHPCSELWGLAKTYTRCLGELVVTRKNPWLGYCYVVKSKLQGRKAFTKGGDLRKDKDSKAYSRSHREPWLLISSLHGRGAAKKVKAIYERRMSIEEAFRDLKSSRYGFGLEDSKTYKKKRRDIWLLIGMLATLIAWLTGRMGEQKGLHYQFQSNSIKKRRVLSLFYLGCQLIRKKVRFTLDALWKAIASLRKEAAYG